MSEATCAVDDLVLKTVRVLCQSFVHFSGGQQLFVVCIEQFVLLERIGELQQVAYGGIATARGCSAIGKRVRIRLQSLLPGGFVYPTLRFVTILSSGSEPELFIPATS